VLFVVAAEEDGEAFGEFNGAPTAISQRCPGWPCGGFIPEGVFAVAVLVVFAGTELSEAPTAISHLWPGCPCGGFIPSLAVIDVATGFSFAGAEFNGAPTATEQECPGLPCGGFISNNSPAIESGAV